MKQRVASTWFARRAVTGRRVDRSILDQLVPWIRSLDQGTVRQGTRMLGT